MDGYDGAAAKKISERMKRQWRDPDYRARMAETAKARKRCSDCNHIYAKGTRIAGVKVKERWLSCRVKPSRVLTGGEFACGDSFEERDEKV